MGVLGDMNHTPLKGGKSNNKTPLKSPGAGLLSPNNDALEKRRSKLARQASETTRRCVLRTPLATPSNQPQPDPPLHPAPAHVSRTRTRQRRATCCAFVARAARSPALRYPSWFDNVLPRLFVISFPLFKSLRATHPPRISPRHRPPPHARLTSSPLTSSPPPSTHARLTSSPLTSSPPPHPPPFRTTHAHARACTGISPTHWMRSRSSSSGRAASREAAAPPPQTPRWGSAR
jgi:hypothetical protein